MKRIINTLILIIFLIVFAVIFTFAGCSSKSNTTSETVKEETSVVETTSTQSQVNEEDLVPSQGLEFKSNGDGTCKIVGIGECKDKDIVIPTVSPSGDKVTLICNNAFENLSGVNIVTLLNYNYKVGEQAFESGEFASLNVIGGSPVIQRKAFAYCNKLTSIYFKSCTVDVGEKAFLDCGKNATVTFYDCTSTIKNKAFRRSPLLSLEVKGGKTTIGERAFSLCKDLSNIIFSNCEVNASDHAFYDCGNLANIEATNSSVVLGDKAFKDSSLNYVSSTGTKFIAGKNAFYDCEDLIGIDLESSNVTLYDNAFKRCEDLKSVLICSEMIDDFTIELGDEVFRFCKNLLCVSMGDLPNTKELYGVRIFNDCSENINIIIDEEPCDVEEFETPHYTDACM